MHSVHILHLFNGKGKVEPENLVLILKQFWKIYIVFKKVNVILWIPGKIMIICGVFGDVYMCVMCTNVFTGKYVYAST